MGIKIIGLAGMIVTGAMLADILGHGQASVNILNSFASMWKTSITTVAGA